LNGRLKQRRDVSRPPTPSTSGRLSGPRPRRRGTKPSPLACLALENCRARWWHHFDRDYSVGTVGGRRLFAWAGLVEPGEPMPSEGYVALALGALVAVLVGIGLMGLVFYSNRRGYDEPPHFHEDH